MAVHCAGAKLCKERAELGTRASTEKPDSVLDYERFSHQCGEETTMRLLIEIATAALIVL